MIDFKVNFSYYVHALKCKVYLLKNISYNLCDFLFSKTFLLPF